MDKEEIKQYLPHREPMLLVDEMTLDENHIAHSKYTIKEDEFFLKGHFPGEPIVPGVILCEIMAQSCALLMKDDLKGKLTLYTGIDNVRFKNSVRPGDVVEVEAELVEHKMNIYVCKARLTTGGKLCVRGDLSFALIPDERKSI
ncbi:MAG: 3-hydroxyacyl-ACP dehydratase FabZ [Bacteroidales bacterium]|nr:3-hydroxyacyl-ACP dehydratase FabZ [Bacteroidales bacterium]